MPTATIVPSTSSWRAKGCSGRPERSRRGRVNALQKVAVEESRLKIPLIFAFDVIHGYRTIFPIPLGEAASWDPAAAERSAAIAARRSAAAGIAWTFAPMVDIARDARWGRIAEGAGEDPYLGAAMARARVRGFQGATTARPDRLSPAPSTGSAYGAAEGGRDYNSIDVSERDAADVYFPPFKAAVDAGVGTFMSAFNDLNGVPASATRGRSTEVLRSEWRFDGMVVSATTTRCVELDQPRVRRRRPTRRALALPAGVDMEMVSRSFATYGPASCGTALPIAVVDEAVRRVLASSSGAGFRSALRRSGARARGADDAGVATGRARDRRAIDGAAEERHAVLAADRTP